MPKILVIFFGSILIVSCSADFHLKRAIKKGSRIKSDTVYVDVLTERTKTDTTVVIKDVLKVDTIRVNTVRWKSKTVIRKDTVWQEVTCEPDTIRVAKYINTEIKAPPSKIKWWHVLIVGLACLVVGRAFR